MPVHAMAEKQSPASHFRPCLEMVQAQFRFPDLTFLLNRFLLLEEDAMTRVVLLGLVVLCLAGCGSVQVSLRYPGAVSATVHRPVRLPGGHGEAGIASYYADKYQGRLTANGERFDMYAMTAAHKSLPFNSRVRVVNVRNGRSVLVRINDRGPFVAGRIIDLSYAAFGRIADHRDGLADVVVEVVD